MDEFVSFSFVSLDASGGPARERWSCASEGRAAERVDVIARQFRDALRTGDSADDSPGDDVDPRLQAPPQIGESSGWLSFVVDRGDGVTERWKKWP